MGEFEGGGEDYDCEAVSCGCGWWDIDEGGGGGGGIEEGGEGEWELVC